MSPRIAALAGLLAPMCLATEADALDLAYMSHLSLHFPEIGLTEPSGLAVAPDGSGFWIVSDETPTVFKLSAEGEIGAYLDRDDRMRDLEGVAADTGADRLLMVSERTGSILVASFDPPRDLRVVEVGALPSPEGLADALDDSDDGLEGIALDPETGSVWILKERNPRLLIEIAASLDRVISVRALDDILPRDEDVSGLALDPARDGFWIASDVGKSIHFLARDLSRLTTFELDWRDGDRTRRLDNPEGVSLSPDGRYLFVLSDDGRNSRLVQYEILAR